MSTLTLAATDSATMLRRQLRHMIRYPSLTLMLLGMPIVFLLMFVYVFGGTLGAGIAEGGGRAEYLAYLTPGLVVTAALSVANGTAVSVAMDMTGGIIARFRTMAIARVAVLTGHVLGALIQTALAVSTTFAVALALGYRPDAGPLQWLGIVGLLALFSLALTWLMVALGLVADSVETASNLPMPLILLPFFGSGFVPTDSMPTGLRWFADYQPFTGVIETLRNLLADQPVGDDAAWAIGWSLAMGVGGYLWAKRLYNRSPAK